MTPDLIVIYEHPEWQKPLFAALERRGLSSAAYDQAATQQDELAPRKNGVEVIAASKSLFYADMQPARSQAHIQPAVAD
jgi:hypothetical protein